MLDAQMHYPVFTHEYRETARFNAPLTKRGSRRIFRLGDLRTPRRETRSR